MLSNSQTEDRNFLIRRLKTFKLMLLKLLPLLSFIIPLIILYSLDPTSFEKTWKGRTYYLFFAWLLALEMILNWEELNTERVSNVKSVRSIAFIVALSIPTAYIVIANFYGLNFAIEEAARQSGIFWAQVMPLSTEYLVFAALFALLILLEYGTWGVKNFSITASFLAIIGVLYTVDNVYPQGRFAPFQIFVPTTAMLSANFLTFIGYRVLWLGVIEGMPTFVAWNSQGSYSVPFSIAWPCSGIESLLIYTATILLFLKKSTIPIMQKVIYFVIGAVITYFINILRIATIFIISINRGDFMAFHDSYGQLYSISWIVSYPLIILGSQTLLTKVRSWRLAQKISMNSLG